MKYRIAEWHHKFTIEVLDEHETPNLWVGIGPTGEPHFSGKHISDEIGSFDSLKEAHDYLSECRRGVIYHEQGTYEIPTTS